MPPPVREEENLLPKEPLDLPREPVEIPSYAEHGYESQSYPQTHAQVKTLLSWKAPGRPFKKRGRQYYLTTLLIMALVEVILFLFAQYLLMLVVLSLVFVSFALSSVPPHDFQYRISTEGITIEDHYYLWQELYDFYFRDRLGIKVLHLSTKAFLPGELTVTLGDLTEEQVKEAILPYLPYREVVRQSFMEKSAEWLSRNFPLEGK